MMLLRNILIAAALLIAGPVAAQQNNLATIDCSGTIASGGVAQTLLSSSGSRLGFMIMNLSTDKLCISLAGTAVCDAAGSYSLSPAVAGATGTAGGSYLSPAGFRNAISIVGATTGDKFSCTAW